MAPVCLHIHARVHLRAHVLHRGPPPRTPNGPRYFVVDRDIIVPTDPLYTLTLYGPRKGKGGSLLFDRVPARTLQGGRSRSFEEKFAKN